MARGMSAWSPGSSAWNTAIAAAVPEANSIEAAPCSKAVSRASAGSKVGLSARP